MRMPIDGPHACAALFAALGRSQSHWLTALPATLGSGAGARRGPLGAWRLAGPLRHPARRPGRAMRADPERGRRGPLRCRAERDHARDRDQKSRLMRVVAPLGVLLPSGLASSSTMSMRPCRFRALPAQWLRRRGRAGGQAARPTQDREDRDLHHLRNPRRRSSASR